MIDNVYNLPRPFFALAPMDDVTDTVFRQVIASCARPDLFFTEFASVDGLQSAGKRAVDQKLKYSASQKPIIVQVWGVNPDKYLKSMPELIKRGFAGVDINMGCPTKKVVKLNACSALINNRPLAKEIIDACRKGLNGKLPLSVKTRIGFNTVDLSWIEFLLAQKLDMLTVHGRIRKQMSKGSNDWCLIGEVAKMRDKISPATLIVGNGDIANRSEGLEIAQKYNLDGVMIGRGIFKDPFVFASKSPWPDYSKSKKLELFRKHIKLFAKTWGADKNPAVLKKFAKIYINGFDGAGNLRTKFMSQGSTRELLELLEKEKSF